MPILETSLVRVASIRYKQLFVYIMFNILAAVLFVVSLKLSKIGFPYLQYPVGLLIFFIPGLTIALALEQLTTSTQSVFRLFLWSFIYSLILNPAAVYLLGGVTGRVPMADVLLLFVIWWAIVSAVYFVFYLFKASPSGLSTIQANFASFKYLRVFALPIGLALGILVVHFVLYPFVPEVDGYGYLMAVDRLRQLPLELTGEPRFLFLLFTHLLSSLSAITPYLLFKFVLPAFCLVPLVVLLRMSQAIKVNWLRWLVVLSLFSTPVVIQEILITRPQTIFFLTLFPICYLLGKVSLERRTAADIFWLFSLLAVVGLGSGFHGMFIIVASLIPLGILVFYYPSIRRSPLDAAIVAAMILFALYPWLAKLDFIGFVQGTGELLINIVQESHFRWWFINEYINVDGNSVGWPGWSAALYYGYNFGIFFPVAVAFLGLLAVRKRIGKVQSSLALWPFVLSILIFFSVAEIFPRFGFSYLPDRAWLFISGLIPALFIVIFQVVEPRQLTRPVRAVLIGSLVLSVVSGWLTTYLKQGYITRRDYKAIPFIRENLPDNSLILTQSGNRVLIKYYAKMQFKAPPKEIFFDSDLKSLEAYLGNNFGDGSTEPDDADTTAVDSANQRLVSQKMINELLASFYVTEEASSSEELVKQLQEMIESYSKLIVSVTESDRNESEAQKAQREQNSTSPVYFLYSSNRFSGLYGMRDWWQKSNFMGANLDKFNAAYRLVYDQAGVKIWEIRK